MRSSVAAIRCDNIDLDEVLQNFGGQKVDFPIKYLGLPITLSRLRVVHMQFILDRIRARLAGWKGQLMNVVGRRVLVRCVLTAMPTFALAVLHTPKKFFRETRRRFLWAGDKELTRGHCKVN